MPTVETLLAFVVVSIGIMVVPGPSNFFILARGVSHGRGAVMAALLGIETAAALRVLLVATGLSAVLASSALAFEIVRWAGAAYLVWLGIQALRSASHDEPATSGAAATSFVGSAVKGFVVGMGNPKMVLFYVAFFPQFVDPSRGSQLTQVLVLGALIWFIGTVWDVVLALAAGALGGWMRQRPQVRRRLTRGEGVTYLGLAAWTAAGSRA